MTHKRRSTAAFVAVAVAGFFAVAEIRASAAIYVNLNSPGPIRDATSWATAYADLQQAIGTAVSGDEVRVAGGTYQPTTNADRTISFLLKNGVRILGGFAGYGAPNPDLRSVLAERSILSGEIGRPDSQSDNSHHVVEAIGVDATTTLDGAIITGGHPNGSTMGDRGGGMYLSNPSPSLINVIFSGNQVYRGGGMFNLYASPTLVNCTFSGNGLRDFSSQGGAVYNETSSPAVISRTFCGNVASAYGGGVGGGIYNWAKSAPTLIDCVLWVNSAADSPQIFGTATATYCDIEGGWSGIGNVNIDPSFKADGLDSLAGTPDDDLRVRSISSVVDAGTNAA